MSSFVYTRAKTLLGRGDLDLEAHDIRLLLVMTNTTANTEEDKTTISGFTTLDEMDGTGYARQALAGEAVNEDTTNNRAEFDATDATFTAVGAGTRQVKAAILYRFITNDTDNIPIAYIDSGGFPFTANGGNIVVQFNVEGIVQLT